MYEKLELAFTYTIRKILQSASSYDPVYNIRWNPFKDYTSILNDFGIKWELKAPGIGDLDMTFSKDGEFLIWSHDMNSYVYTQKINLFLSVTERADVFSPEKFSLYWNNYNQYIDLVQTILQ